MKTAEELCAGEVQGLALYGYGHHAAAAFMGFTVRDPARARQALARFASRITYVGSPRDDDYMNVAFSVRGMEALGLPAEVAAWFPVELREGMAGRAARLGDTQASDPASWRWGGPDNPEVHVVVMVYAFNRDVPKDDDAAPASRGTSHGSGRDKGRPDPRRLFRLVRRTARELRASTDQGRAMSLSFVEWTQLLDDRVEHFGFRDGLVQPRLVDGPATEEADAHAALPLGEVVLGHPNDYGEIATTPRLESAGEPSFDLGTHGTYLVLRALDQDVAGFWSAMADQAIARLGATGAAGPSPSPSSRPPSRPSSSEIEDTATFLAAKIVGRWPNGLPIGTGAPLVGPAAWSGGPVSADLDFKDDPRGLGCPMGAHVRRVNPRDALGTDDQHISQKVVNRHRLVRRGRPYGPRLLPFEPDDGKRRGLMFVTVGASIRRQFEFVQQQWVENPTFQRLVEEDDPLIGQRIHNEDGRFTIPADPWRERLQGLPRFVTTRGGGYYFMPGRAAYLRLVKTEA